MGAYLSAREAADYCGVSEKTIRNWLASGRLSADKSAGSFRIPQEQLDTLRRDGPRSPQGADRQPEGSAEDVRAEGPQSSTAELVALVRDLQGELMRRTEAAATWQTRAEVLALQLEDARAQLALSAPANAPKSRQDANLTAESPEPPPGGHPSPSPSPLGCRRRSRRGRTGARGGAACGRPCWAGSPPCAIVTRL
jgi:excisionase family DNA binding protein